jgi:hypothetical protein
VRLVYHSVLHPQTEQMPHHWHKLRVEEMLLESRLPWITVAVGREGRSCEASPTRSRQQS